MGYDKGGLVRTLGLEILNLPFTQAQLVLS